MTVKIQLRSRVSDVDMKRRKGTPIGPDDMHIELHGDVDVYGPNGKPVCLLRRGIVSQVARDSALPELKWLKGRYTTDNRGAYTGHQVAGKGNKGKGFFARKDGRISRQTRTVDDSGKAVQVNSAVIGYYDRVGGRFPYCRQTAFIEHEPDRWKNILPLVKEVSAHFGATMSKRYKVQQAYADSCSPDFRIPGTPFSTLTVNNNVCGTVHQDAGDFKDGFGVIGCFREGDYTGGQLCFPRYKVFVDFQDSDLIFFDPHEWHGVNQMHHDGDDDDVMRMTVVYYFRKKLCDCGTVEEELARCRDRYGAIE